MADYKPLFVTAMMPDGKAVHIKRFSPLARPGLTDFKEMYQELIGIFVASNAHIGDILASPKGLKIIQDMAIMLPLVDGDQGLDVNALIEAGDMEQICSLFVTASMQTEGKYRGEYKKGANGEDIVYEPGQIAKLNHLDFFGYINQVVEARKAKEEERSQARLAETVLLLDQTKNGSSAESTAVATQQ